MRGRAEKIARGQVVRDLVSSLRCGTLPRGNEEPESQARRLSLVSEPADSLLGQVRAEGE